MDTSGMRIVQTLHWPGKLYKLHNQRHAHSLVWDAGNAMFRTFQGYRCGAGTYNDLAVLVFNPQVCMCVWGRGVLCWWVLGGSW